MSVPTDEPLPRDRVEHLINSGVSWVVTYCSGAHKPPATGRGAPLPRGVLENVPTAAALRKIARGQSDKTYFHAKLAGRRRGQVLELTEG